MKRIVLKRIAYFFLAVGITASLAACKKETEPPLASKENIFSAQELDIPVKLSNIEFMQSNGENIYVYGSVSESAPAGTDENGEEITTLTTKSKLIIMDMDGSLVKDATVSESGGSFDEEREISENKYVNSSVIDSNGSLWLLETINIFNMRTNESSRKYGLTMLNSDGNSEKSIDLSGLNEDNNENFFIYSFTVDNEGNIYVLSDNDIYVLDNNGNMLFTIEGEQQSGNSGEYLGKLNRAEDGRIFAYGSSWRIENNENISMSFFKEIDIASKGFGNTYETNKVLNDITDGKNGYDLIAVTETSLSGYDIETDTFTTVVDWLKSGFSTNMIQNPTILPDGRIICTTRRNNDIITSMSMSSVGGVSFISTSSSISAGSSEPDTIISILTKVDPKDVPDKKLVKIACWYLDPELRSRAAEFNKTNLSYQIEVTSYMEEAGYNDANTRLNNDLIAGNIPDILIMNATMPVNNYISKGLLADLYTFIDDDAEISREDFLPNILEAYSVNDKLYSMIPGFYIQTVTGKSSAVGDTPGWNMDDFKKVAEANPGKKMFNMLTQTGFLDNALTMSLDNFINPETGECSFDTPEFISLLEYANTFPGMIDYEAYYNSGTDFYLQEQTQYRTDEVLLAQAYLNSFSAIREMEKGQFGEPVTFIGFPGSDSNGSSISSNYEFAVMSKAKNPQGAWEFLRYYLTPEYQNQLEFQFPVINSAMDMQMEKAKEKPFYMNGDEKVDYERTYWLGSESIEIGVNTDEDNQKVLDFIKSVNTPLRYDQELTKIITEETASYFSGQKKAEEAAEIIQNRVSVYINESR